MVDSRLQDEDIIYKFDQKLYKIISKAIKVSVEPYTTNKTGQLYHCYDIKDIDGDIQDSVYKRVNKL